MINRVSNSSIPAGPDHKTEDDGGLRNLKLKDAGDVQNQPKVESSHNGSKSSEASASHSIAGDHAPAAQERKMMGALEGRLKAAELGTIVDTGRDLLEKGADLASTGVGAVKDKFISLGSESLKQIERKIDEASNAVDPDKQIDDLKNEKDGSSVSVAVGAGATFPVNGVPVGIKAQGKVEIKKENGKYTVSADGELGAGLAGKIKGGDASAGVAAGGKVEMQFDNPEDAKRAVRILAGGSGKATSKPSSLGQLVQAGGLTTKDVSAVAPSKEDAEFLSKNITAIEVKSNIAAEAALKATASEDINVAGLTGSSQGKVEGTLRMEMKNGEPTALVIKTSASTEGKASAGLGGTGVQGGISDSTTVTAEYRFPVDKNFPKDKLFSSQFKSDPFADFTPAEKESFRKAAQNQEVSLSISKDTKFDGWGNGKGVKAELKITANSKGYWGDPANQQKIRELVAKEKTPEAVKELGKGVGVEGKVEYYRQSGVSLKPSISDQGGGVSAEVGLSKQEVLESKSYKGNATDVGESMASYEPPPVVYSK